MGACLLSRVCPKPVLLPESSCGPFGAARRAVSPGFFIQVHTGSMRFGKTACAVFSVGDKLARHPVPVKDFSGNRGRKCHDSGRKRLFSRGSGRLFPPAFLSRAGAGCSARASEKGGTVPVAGGAGATSFVSCGRELPCPRRGSQQGDDGINGRGPERERRAADERKKTGWNARPEEKEKAAPLFRRRRSGRSAADIGSSRGAGGTFLPPAGAGRIPGSSPLFRFGILRPTDR